MEKSNQEWKEMYEKECKLRQETEKENYKVREDNRKLSQQIEDSIDRMRKAGLL
jgi:hypothetical protein|tara:strand:+ start:301 stop:462 length:162 start_codon:yes stop_codon:yes gene_type:complete